VKDVCHIWELGGGAQYTNLVETPLSPDKPSSTAMVLVVDLARPERLWALVTGLVSSVREYIGAALQTERARGLCLEERLGHEGAARVGEDHGDLANIRPFPIPLLIPGGQYDKFQDFEPGKKKIICRSLRFLAHLTAPHCSSTAAAGGEGAGPALPPRLPQPGREGPRPGLQ
jgi:dynein light intermediate chain 2